MATDRKPEKTPFDAHAPIPVWNAETWLYEDLVVGHKTKSIRRTISEGEAMMFNCMVMDLHPYVADEEFATKEGVFGRRLVSGAQVFSYGLGLFAHNNTQTFSYGYDKLRFIGPTFIGDTIYGIRTILYKHPKTADMGVMCCSYEIFKVTPDGGASQVLYCEHLQTVKYRNPAGMAGQIPPK